ncbi:Ppx/GppA phosphatase family protein [Emcibacter nanhaiensis]|uniref:Ppx/GppA family phosphatase n=1 Tax=Emcibacter nanhaiensis TaxID=1505037 RepID=A0A501PS39_9PROT|nr:Ppx/GppA phosphatase family protein [Emcibacter nanhaiensis]TPD62927.1 Ppx/GppA family phosphatase [Emcibacter nanhaiensis]
MNNQVKINESDKAAAKSDKSPGKKQTRKGSKSRFFRNRNNTPAFGAIDLGTNNCRLLVAHPTASGFKVVDAFSRIVRLGEGLSSSGELSEQAIERTLEALRICVEKMERRQVRFSRNVATQACREAGNCAEFMERVEREVRIKLDIIDPQEEARLAVMGCKALLDERYSNAIVFDIGGGSTELIWLRIGENKNPEIIGWTSVPYGVVNLSEKYGTKHALTDDQYLEMKNMVKAELEAFEEQHGMRAHVERGEVQLLGTSGTITTLTSMHLDLERYDRDQVDGTWVTSAHMQGLCMELSRMSYEQRAARGGIGLDRAELVVAGCAILEAIMDLWPIEHIRVADRGIREGVLLDLMEQNRPKQRSRNNRSGKKKFFRRRRKKKTPGNPATGENT